MTHDCFAMLVLSPEEIGEPIARGRTADVYALDSDRVLKLLVQGRSAHEAEVEAAANLAIAEIELPTPRLLARALVGGRNGLVFDRIEGELLAAELARDPAAMEHVTAELASLHAELHRHEAPRLRPVKEKLAVAIRRAPLGEAIRDAALARLSVLPDGDALLHMDFHPFQIMRTAAGTVVLDWVDAAKGAPAADVARTALLLTAAQIDAPGLEWLNQGLYRSALAHRYVNAYCRQTGVTVGEIEAWYYPLAAARRAEVDNDNPAMLAWLEAGVHDPEAQPFMGAKQ